jgi:hypothetical protein
MTRLILATVLALSVAASAATSRPMTTTRLDVFETFRLLDEQFSKLDGNYHDLQQALATRESQKQARKAWRRELRKMQQATTRIRQLSRRMYSQYRRPSRDLRYRMFEQLDQGSRRLNKQLIALQQQTSRNAVQKGNSKMRRAMLDLVLQYQALSGGYAATNCEAGAWSCGVAKDEPRRVGYPKLGVKWTCAARRNSCHGILGPRTPALNPEPLTAGAIVH